MAVPHPRKRTAFLSDLIFTNARVALMESGFRPIQQRSLSVHKPACCLPSRFFAVDNNIVKGSAANSAERAVFSSFPAISLKTALLRRGRVFTGNATG